MGSTGARTDDRALLLRAIEEAYDKESWAGNNLRGAIAGMGASEAAWVAPGGKHSAAAVVVHCAYWKAVIRKRLLGEARIGFPLEGEDWFEIEAGLSGERWAEYVSILDGAHERLCAAVGEVDRDLTFGAAASSEAVSELIGIAAHDAYHAGQIALLKAQHGRLET